jgi:predicted GNAT family acetyltransferase
VSAGALLVARGEGVSRGILFTGHDNAPARKAYEAIGFEVTGEFGLLLFDPRLPHTLSSLTT